jgi:hypothetical protein
VAEFIVEIHRWGSWVLCHPEGDHSGIYATLEEARVFYCDVVPSAGLARIMRVHPDGTKEDVTRG